MQDRPTRGWSCFSSSAYSYCTLAKKNTPKEEEYHQHTNVQYTYRWHDWLRNTRSCPSHAIAFTPARATSTSSNKHISSQAPSCVASPSLSWHTGTRFRTTLPSRSCKGKLLASISTSTMRSARGFNEFSHCTEEIREQQHKS